MTFEDWFEENMPANSLILRNPVVKEQLRQTWAASQRNVKYRVKKWMGQSAYNESALADLFHELEKR